MGPVDNHSKSAITSHPQHVWDVRTVPCTDGIGDQGVYVLVVRQWSLLYDDLPERNSKKTQKNLRSICLHAQISGWEMDVCKGLTNDQLQQDDTPSLICSMLYRRDTMSVISKLKMIPRHYQHTSQRRRIVQQLPTVVLHSTVK